MESLHDFHVKLRPNWNTAANNETAVNLRQAYNHRGSPQETMT